MKHQHGILISAAITLLLICLVNSDNSLVLSQATDQTVTDNWSMYRHNLERSGLTPSSAPNGTLVWRFFTGNSPTYSSLSDRLRASPTIVDGVLYMGTNNTSFYALNATSGSVIWRVTTPANVESSAAVADGVVYVGILWGGSHGYVDAFNATTGTLIWQYLTNGGIESSPAVANGVVYVGSASRLVYALNASNGALLWSYLTGGMMFSSPAVVSGVVYIGSVDGKVYALNADTGALVLVHFNRQPNLCFPSSR